MHISKEVNYILSFIMYNLLYDDVHNCVFSAVKIKTMMTMIMNICYTNLQLLKTK